MAFRTIFAALLCVLLPACSQVDEGDTEAPQRIVSLDYCADQYVLRFADRESILALSPDADRDFSFLRDEAKGLPQVRARSADIVALEPDVVVRSYGGGPNVTHFLERAGVRVVQIGYPQTIAEVRQEVLRIGSELGQPDEADSVADEMDRRLAALSTLSPSQQEVLYMAARGVTTGEGSLVHELITAAGLANYQEQPGWNPIPLERLAYDRPDLVAAAYFDRTTEPVDSWSAARHPIAQAQLRELPVVPIEGSWTSCGAWFQLEVVEALAQAREAEQ
jgi:iron complex transport system substrate-binding protein